MQNYKRLLSIFLIATFISTNTPITILAQGIDDLANKIVSSTQLERSSKKEVVRKKQRYYKR
jgi:hypothetical protein